MVAERDGDRALEMGVAGHRRVGVLRRAVEDRVRERVQPSIRLGARVGDVEPKCGRHLVVPRPPRMDLAAHLAEVALDRRVDVLVGLEQVAGADQGESLLGLGQLVVAEQAGGMQAVRVDQRPLDVVGQELGVVCAQELPHLGRQLAADPAGPERHD